MSVFLLTRNGGNDVIRRVAERTLPAAAPDRQRGDGPGLPCRGYAHSTAGRYQGHSNRAQPYPGDEATREAVRLFHREAQTIARLNHPHILPLFDFDEASSDGSTPTHMVMPVCLEGPLAALLRQLHHPGALMPHGVVHPAR